MSDNDIDSIIKQRNLFRRLIENVILAEGFGRAQIQQGLLQSLIEAIEPEKDKSGVGVL